MKNDLIPNLEENLYKFHGKIPFDKALPLSLQHVVAMVVGCITVPMMVGAAGNISAQDQVIMIQASLLCASIAIFLQVLSPKIVGSSLPVMIGSGFAFMPSLISIVKEYGLAGVLGAQLCAAFVGIIIGLMFKRIRFLFPPVVTSSVVITIGISLYGTAANYMAGGNSKLANYGSVQNWFVALITLITVIGCSQYGKGVVKSCSTLIGILVGYALSFALGMITFDGVALASWVQIPKPFNFGLEFYPSAIILLSIVFAVNAVQDIGQFEATSNGAYGRAATEKEISGGVIANNLSSFFGALLGGVPVATCGQNVGIVMATKVLNKYVFALSALIIASVAFVPKLSALLLTIPQPVLGGATLTVFANMAMVGIRMLSKAGLTNRNVFIAGISVALAIGIPVTNGAFALFPQWFISIFAKSQIVIVACTSILLNLILPIEKE